MKKTKGLPQIGGTYSLRFPWLSKVVFKENIGVCVIALCGLLGGSTFALAFLVWRERGRKESLVMNDRLVLPALLVL